MDPNRLKKLWWLAALTGVALVVGLLEQTAAWSSLDGGLRSLDFDPERSLLIEAWLAGAVVAMAGALVSTRPWPSAGAGTGFAALTYVVPLGGRLTHQVPALFGTPERVARDVLLHNQLVVLAVAFLLALVAAAAGDLLGREVKRLAMAARSRREVARSVVHTATLLLATILAIGADPLLRQGPQAGVYSPGPSSRPEIRHSTGEVRRLTYKSEVMGEARRFIIYLPPTYGLVSAAARHYPTLYLLHGDPSAPDEWLNYGTPALFDAGSANGQLAETIVVMPDGNGRFTAATQWANRRSGGDRIEDATLELVAFIDRTYRTVADRQGRTIAGLSSGAYGAVNIAARHPDLFAVAMGFSGYYLARGPVFGTDRAYINANSPTVLVENSLAARTVRYILTTGTVDGYRSYAERFVAELRRLGVAVDFSVIPGGHGSSVYWNGLLYGLNLLRPSVCEPQFGVVPVSASPYATPATCQKASR